MKTPEYYYLKHKSHKLILILDINNLYVRCVTYNNKTFSVRLKRTKSELKKIRSNPFFKIIQRQNLKVCLQGMPIDLIPPIQRNFLYLFPSKTLID